MRTPRETIEKSFLHISRDKQLVLDSSLIVNLPQLMKNREPDDRPGQRAPSCEVRPHDRFYDRGGFCEVGLLD